MNRERAWLVAPGSAIQSVVQYGRSRHLLTLPAVYGTTHGIGVTAGKAGARSQVHGTRFISESLPYCEPPIPRILFPWHKHRAR